MKCNCVPLEVARVSMPRKLPSINPFPSFQKRSHSHADSNKTDKVHTETCCAHSRRDCLFELSPCRSGYSHSFRRPARAQFCLGARSDMLHSCLRLGHAGDRRAHIFFLSPSGTSLRTTHRPSEKLRETTTASSRSQLAHRFQCARSPSQVFAKDGLPYVLLRNKLPW